MAISQDICCLTGHLSSPQMTGSGTLSHPSVMTVDISYLGLDVPNQTEREGECGREIVVFVWEQEAWSPTSA
ncbi:hypothetical protein MPTK1_2g25190 [Marchantia polymorpha subsp. ruderalis]|uniref:Uncharacterized protein n=1 Tax=Marchantia polymorpha TaxID=3197 RepID=A0A2R6W345_MARPO|nr:hypothetical protein MARPO_0168s0014 [Marchantia polymorpha]BBN03652.1 hypothetical protein Mp_2g25190 [Marchantia polymorpha subsp. ruderalis]|eukprot:PTQ28290.1 hypothetical protein MARPO_0168s0014 [Marchantia polymorpha]